MSAPADRPAARPRVLDNDGVFRRVKALDALYLNADRRYREMMALPPDTDKAALGAALDAWTQAKRAYEQCRDTPYVIAAQETS